VVSTSYLVEVLESADWPVSQGIAAQCFRGWLLGLDSSTLARCVSSGRRELETGRGAQTRARKTGYKIFDWYKDCGITAFTDRSRRPHRQANRLPGAIEATIVRLKREYPGWGAPKIREKLRPQFAGPHLPAISTVHALLDRHQLVQHRRRRRPPPPICQAGPNCNSAQSSPASVIPGVVFSGSVDGGIRAFSTKNGAILWKFDTNREFETTNGVRARGASINGNAGPVIVDGMLYVSSGYAAGGSRGRRAGNVLLSFGVE
jgi:homeodomain-containing protein/PQQ enzyme-like repeat protein